jgi:hypothetical protein
LGLPVATILERARLCPARKTIATIFVGHRVIVR